MEFLLVLFTSIGLSQDQQLKQRVNLEDVSIQGESSRSRMLLQSRERFELDSRIKPRVNFRKEIKQELEREKKSSFLKDAKSP
jgi:wyosine [tRNA(Phe)-imidazoG37] synthetase (radical SAM superfamily)